MAGKLQSGKGLWEGETPPITALPDRNQGGAAEVRLGEAAAIIFRASGSGDYSWTATVDLGIADEEWFDDARSPRNGQVVALVEWGHGAASFTAEVDVKKGTSFTVVATSIKVSAFIDTEGGVDDGTLQSAVVDGALIWGTRAARAYTTRTQTRLVPAVAVDSTPGSVLLQIPNFAETLSISAPDADVMNGGTGPVTLTFLAGPFATDAPILQVDNSANFFRALSNGNGLRFPEGARSLLVENGSDSDLLLSAIWGLYL